MSMKKQHRWLAMSTIALALSATTLSPAFAKDPPKTEAKKADATGEEKMAYDKLPDKAREAVNKVRAKAKVLSAAKTSHGGEGIFRVVVAGTDGGARSIHVTAKGTITNVEDIRPADLAAFNQDPESWHQATEARQAALVQQQTK